MTSDECFIKEIHPLITKTRLNKVLKPMGLFAIGKGVKFGPKREFIRIFIRDNRNVYVRVVMSGSDYMEDDDMLSVYLYDYKDVEIDSNAKVISNDPKKDVEWMIDTLVELCKCAAHYNVIKIEE